MLWTSSVGITKYSILKFRFSNKYHIALLPLELNWNLLFFLSRDRFWRQKILRIGTKTQDPFFDGMIQDFRFRHTFESRKIIVFLKRLWAVVLTSNVTDFGYLEGGVGLASGGYIYQKTLFCGSGILCKHVKQGVTIREYLEMFGMS